MISNRFIIDFPSVAQANQLEIVDLMVNTHMHLDIKTGRVQEVIVI